MLVMRRTERGDTIVEVLIAIVVASAVLVGSFAITNASLKQIRMAQERSEAQKFAESTIENLSGLIKAHPEVAGRDPALPFCIGSDATGLLVLDTTPPGNCSTGPDSRYQLAVNRVASGPGDSYTFKTKVTWENVSGREENVTMFYRAQRPGDDL